LYIDNNAYGLLSYYKINFGISKIIYWLWNERRI